MRSKRCTSCGVSFLTADPSRTECQQCAGDLPDTSEADRRAAETEQRKADALSSKTQQVNLRDLTDASEGQQQLDLKSLAGTTPVKRRRRRSNKADAVETAPAETNDTPETSESE